MGAGGSVPRPVASCEWFLTCSSWRALRAFARPTDMGLSLHSPDRQQICLVGMLVIGCLCGSTLLWVAKSSLDGYLLARLTLFCRLGSRNVGGILVVGGGECLVTITWIFAGSHGCCAPLLALWASVPQTSGGPLHGSLLLRLIVKSRREERADVHVECLSDRMSSDCRFAS